MYVKALALAYQCTTCQFYFHLKCLFTLNNDKHHHPLTFLYVHSGKCNICGSGISEMVFGCNRCGFYIHQECSLIPLEIKHHHVHKLTLRFIFPEECDQVYCDRCEDRDGEMDRTQFYYYCKDCDYIAHVRCCIPQPEEDLLLRERFTHEHPLRHTKTEGLLSCSQCSYTVSEETHEYPSLVKHPHHPDHTFLFYSKATHHFNCTECNFSMDEYEFREFTHPLWPYPLRFICNNNLFRCNACCELGKGSRLFDDDFDLHLECFAFPGKLEHESHPNHPLFLRSLYQYTSRCCSVCTKEMDPQLWFYFCQECNYAAHMDCVARDLLSTLRSSIKNQSDFCAIIEPDESSFKYFIAAKRPAQSYSIPMLQVKREDEYDGNDDDDDEVDDADEGNYDLGIETIAYGLACPKCNSLIATQAGYSTIKDWRSSFLKDRFETANDQTLSGSEPLNFLDEQIVDELCCSICNIIIFPPTYSCASCQIYFHKSCAELPRKILFNKTRYVLTAPPFPEGLSDCTRCKHPICSWAYLSSVDCIIFDLQCASGAPLVNRTHNSHGLSFPMSCPKCNLLIKYWKSSFLKDGITAVGDQIPSESESLNSLNEQTIDELCCSICSMLIFPPTYSCASCQIFFHKSCAQLPRSMDYNSKTYVLMAPPFPEGLSDCKICKNPIYSWAYFCSVEGNIFHVQCASREPSVNWALKNHDLSISRVIYIDFCRACTKEVKGDTFMMRCDDCKIYLHPECGILPAVIKHRIHQHPLELATDLAVFDCEYICDVCEKDLNPDLWAYRCVDICGKYATSHVSCVITSKKKCHFSYDLECQTWTEEKKLEFWTKARERGKRTDD